MFTWLLHGSSLTVDIDDNHGLHLFVARHSCRAVAGRKHFKDVRSQIRNTVFLGIVYGLIDTLPMVLVILI